MALSIVVLLTAGLIVGWSVHNSALSVAAALLLLFVFSSAMIWIGTWIGLAVRTPDAVMGVGFVIVFPMTFLSNAFVPINSLPRVLQDIAAWNPVSVVVAAVRQLFGNPGVAVTLHTWPLAHPVVSAFTYCGIILAITVPASLRQYRAEPATDRTRGISPARLSDPRPTRLRELRRSSASTDRHPTVPR